MKIPTQKTNSRLARRQIAVHATDLLVSSVFALFIVTALYYTNGIENLSLDSTYQAAYNYFSIFQSWENMQVQIQQKESMLLGCSIVLTITIATIVCYSILHTHFYKKINKEDDERQQKYQKYFAGTVAQNSNPLKLNQSKNSIANKNREHLSIEDLTNIDNRILLLKELKAMHSLINGEEKLRLKELYYGLGFIDDLPTKFLSSDWVRRVEAILEVKQFEVSKYYPTIFKLINDSHSTVRRNSIIARIDLEENPLKILEDLNSKLSIWEKHSITLALDKLPHHLIPNFQDLMRTYPIHHEFLSEMKTHFNQGNEKIGLPLNARLHVV